MLTPEERKIVTDSYDSAISKYNKSFEIFIPTDDKTFDQFNFWGNSNSTHCNLQFGEIFLYQTIEWNKNGFVPDVYTGKMSYPKLAMFLEFLPCDQTLEFRYINRPRTWMNNVEYISNPTTDAIRRNYDKSSVAERGAEIESYIPWGNSEIYVFGRWSSIPDWKQLRRAYEKSVWFYTNTSQLRDRAIDTIV